MGGIKERYHQIFVSPKDQDALCFVWRKFSTDPIEDYRMSLHICGVLRDFVTCAQFKKREKHPWRSVTFGKNAN